MLDLFLGFVVAQDYHYLHTYKREEILKDATGWPEFRYQLFWYAVAAARCRAMDGERLPTMWWQVRWDIRDFWTPSANDLERLFESLKHKSLMDDRLIALTAIFTVYIHEGRPRQLRERMKRVAAGTPELEAQLHELFHPKSLSEGERQARRQQRDFKRRQEAREKRQNAIRLKNQQVLKKNPEEIKNVGNAQKGQIWQRTTYLYDQMREKGDKNKARLGYSNWKVLSDEFGSEVAKNFRDGCIAYWYVITIPLYTRIGEPIVPYPGRA